LVGRPEHEVVDEQLGAAVEEIGEGLRTVLGLEAVVLLEWDRGQLAPLPGQLVAAAGELLLLLQQLVALRLPLLLRADPVLRHQGATSCLRPQRPDNFRATTGKVPRDHRATPKRIRTMPAAQRNLLPLGRLGLRRSGRAV